MRDFSSSLCFLVSCLFARQRPSYILGVQLHNGRQTNISTLACSSLACLADSFNQHCTQHKAQRTAAIEQATHPGPLLCWPVTAGVSRAGGKHTCTHTPAGSHLHHFFPSQSAINEGGREQKSGMAGHNRQAPFCYWQHPLLVGWSEMSRLRCFERAAALHSSTHRPLRCRLERWLTLGCVKATVNMPTLGVDHDPCRC